MLEPSAFSGNQNWLRRELGLLEFIDIFLLLSFFFFFLAKITLTNKYSPDNCLAFLRIELPHLKIPKHTSMSSTVCPEYNVRKVTAFPDPLLLFKTLRKC